MGRILGAGGAGVVPVKQDARPHDRYAERGEPLALGGVGGDDDRPARGGTGRQQLDDAVVGRVGSRPPGVADLDTAVGALRQVRQRPAVDHQQDRRPVHGVQAHEPGVQAAHRARPVAPPPVGPGPDHVQRVDDELVHRRLPVVRSAPSWRPSRRYRALTMSNQAPRPPSRLTQIAQVFNATRKADPRLLPIMLAVALGVVAVFVVVGLLLDLAAVLIPLGVLFGLLGALAVFSQRAQAMAMANIEGRTGAAAAVLGSLRRPWRVTPGIAFNRRQDMVHVAVGRPGVVLVAEGAPAGAAALLKQERRRLARVVGDVPVHEVVVGNEEGQVPLRRLSNHFLRLPNAIKKEEVEGLDNRLKALGSSSPAMPKGPIPRSPRARRPR